MLRYKYLFSVGLFAIVGVLAGCASSPPAMVEDARASSVSAQPVTQPRRAETPASVASAASPTSTATVRAPVPMTEPSGDRATVNPPLPRGVISGGRQPPQSLTRAPAQPGAPVATRSAAPVVSLSNITFPPGDPALRPATALGDSNAPSIDTSPAPASASTTRSARSPEVLLTALSAAGLKYKRGGKSMATGFDCSGLVAHVFKEAYGLSLPPTSYEQANHGRQVEREELQPGDLVFFNTMRRAYSHVGIYLGDNRFIHSPRTGAVVRTENMNLAYWKTRFNGARRLVD